MVVHKSIVFLCGVPRSGTTALTEAINLHDEAVIGIERFKYILARAKTLDEPLELFREERFFDYRPDDTNIRLAGGKFGHIYNRAAEKFAAAEVIGDKVPMLYKRLPFLREHFPGCKALVILRRPDRVASSWQQRADNPKDHWPEENDFRAGVSAWNDALKQITEQKQQMGDDLILLSYEKSFGPEGPSVFSELFDQIGLGPDVPPQIADFLGQAKQQLANAKPVADRIATHSEANADFTLYNRLLQNAI